MSSRLCAPVTYLTTFLLSACGEPAVTPGVTGPTDTVAPDVDAADTSEPAETHSVQFSQLQIVGAYPARKQAGGSWARMCGTGAVDGLITNVVLQTTQRADPSASGADLDLSIRPLDVLQNRVVEGSADDDIKLSEPGHMSLDLGCIDRASTTATCQGALGSARLDRVTYEANTPDRQTGHNVMVLIDQSGSISGLVEADSFEEARSPRQLAPNFGELASDRFHRRLAVAKRLLTTLNARDRAGVLAFGELEGLVVPCSLATQDVQQDLQACFGAQNRDIWFDAQKGIDGLSAKTGGRSNLWLAVKVAYDHLRAKNDRERSNHIIVLSDGPDTCAGEKRGSCQTPCTTADFADLSAQVEADHDDPNAPKIRIHFIQFESLGYPGRDARQVEISCISGGHYQFLDSNQFPSSTSTLADALERAMMNVRYALMGHWALASSVPTYASNAGGGAGVPAGDLYAFDGQLVVKSEANLSSTGLERAFPFGVGTTSSPTPDAIPHWDRRPTVRKPCAGSSDCGASSAPGSCQTVCSAETLTCANGPSPVTLPNLATCSSSQGASGFCCQGACLTAGTCAACAN